MCEASGPGLFFVRFLITDSSLFIDVFSLAAAWVSFRSSFPGSSSPLVSYLICCRSYSQTPLTARLIPVSLVLLPPVSLLTLVTEDSFSLISVIFSKNIRFPSFFSEVLISSTWLIFALIFIAFLLLALGLVCFSFIQFLKLECFDLSIYFSTF